MSTSLAAQMRSEAKRMNDRARDYREVADQLDAKADALRRKAQRLEAGPSQGRVSKNQTGVLRHHGREEGDAPGSVTDPC